MEFIEGTPITKFVQRENIGLRGRLQLFLKVCSAIDLAHRHHIVHRDIKPGNVLVNENREPRLLDFGIAKLLGDDWGDEQVTFTAERRLTPLYAAPEQNAGQTATIASDVYSLGALLYELLTNRPPPDRSNVNSLENDSSKRLTEPLPSHVVTNPQTKLQLRGQLDQIVAKAMRRDPEQRYSSAAELSKDIERYLDGGAPRPEHPARGTSWHRWQIAAASLGAIVLATALLFSLRNKFAWPKSAQTSPPHAAVAHSIAVLPFELPGGGLLVSSS